MRIAIAAVALLALAGSAVPAAAQQAPTYRYCLVEGGFRGSGGSTLCRFNTYAQCMASKTGWSDYCIINPWLTQRK